MLKHYEVAPVHRCPEIVALQKRIVFLVAQGYTAHEMARMFNKSEAQIKNYLREIYNKLGVWTRLELALWYTTRYRLYVPINTKHICVYCGCNTGLTNRNLEVLGYLLTGMNNKEIGREMKIAERTVKFYITKAMQYYGVKNRVQLAVVYYLSRKEQARKEQAKTGETICDVSIKAETED